MQIWQSPELLERYDKPGPRYTSYPTAIEFTEEFGVSDYLGGLSAYAAEPEAPLSLYVHLPFCEARCSFCACHVVVTKTRSVADAYLARVEKEAELLAASLGDVRTLSQYHWGGGTPTHLSPADIEVVWNCLMEHFELVEDAEVSIEVHPPVTTRAQMETLARLGFNRVSFGVQDLDPGVQEMINRHQSLKQTEDVLTWARELGFNSVNFDLIYGLPGQTLDTWNYTLDQVVEAAKKISAKVDQAQKTTTTISTIQRMDAAPSTSVEAPVVLALKKAVKEVYNVDAKPMGIGGGTVAACIRRKGFSAAVWAAMDETMHGPDEYCIIDNLIGDAKVFAHLLLA